MSFSRAMPHRPVQNGPNWPNHHPNDYRPFRAGQMVDPYTYQQLQEEGPVIIPKWQRNVHVWSEVAGLGLGAFMGWVAMNQEFKMPDWVRKVIGVGAVGTIAVDGLLILSYLSRRPNVLPPQAYGYGYPPDPRNPYNQPPLR